MRGRKALFGVAVLTILVCLLLAAPSLQPSAASTQFGGTTTRVSVASDGTQADTGSGWASISADGRYVAFYTYAANLVPGDTNGQADVFVHDRQTGQTTRVSVASNGAQGDDGSGFSSISADGRYVAFSSFAANLVPGDTNGLSDIFVHDRQTGRTRRVSVASDGTQAMGQFQFEYGFPSISANGRYVAFTFGATNLVPGDTNNKLDVFVHDRRTHQTTRVSVSSEGAQANNSSKSPFISANGRYVAFASMAKNLVPGDTNNDYDVFVHDRQTGQTTRVSVSSEGAQANNSSLGSSVSADGRYVAFDSSATNLVTGDINGDMMDVFVHDRQTGETTRVSVASDGTQGDDLSGARSISADGRYVAFYSYAANLVPGDTNGQADVFVHDRHTGQTTRVSVASDGTQANGESIHDYARPSISADGWHVVFCSHATNLVPGDTNGYLDVFVHLRSWVADYQTYVPLTVIDY